MKQFFEEDNGKLSMQRLIAFGLVTAGILLICVSVIKDVFYSLPVIENSVVISDGHIPIEVYGVLLGMISAGIGGKVLSKGREGKEVNLESSFKLNKNDS